MATVPIYIAKVAADPNRPEWLIESKDHYVATLLMPGAVHGVGVTPEEAKEDLRSQMLKLLGAQRLSDVRNDTLEL